MKLHSSIVSAYCLYKIQNSIPGKQRKTEIPEGCEIIDAEGLYVGPGFVDIHTHSNGVVFFQDEPERASLHHLKHGTTTLFPALYFSMDTDSSY